MLGLIYPSPSSELTLGGFSHSPLLLAGSTALTGEVAPGSLPGRALPSLPFPGPPVPPTPPPAALVVASLSFHTWCSTRMSPSSPCPQSQQVAARTDWEYWRSRLPRGCIMITQAQPSGYMAGPEEVPLSGLWVAQSPYHLARWRGWLSGRFLEWDLQTKSHLLLRNIEQFLSEFLSLTFFFLINIYIKQSSFPSIYFFFLHELTTVVTMVLFLLKYICSLVNQ